MRKWALAAAGGVSRSCLSEVPDLGGKLGPVASTSFRLATRIANSIKAGFAVRELSQLEESAMVLFCAPGAALGRLRAALRQASLNWKGKVLLICDSGDYSSAFSDFSRSGASLGSLNPVEGFAGRYIVEGDEEGLRQAKLLVRSLRGKAIEVQSGKTLLYDAGCTLAGSLFTPLIESSVECMRQAGVPGPVATSMAEALLQRSLRSFMHSGRKSWTGPVARADHHAIDSQGAALLQIKPLLGSYFRTAAEFALDLYQTFPELTRYNRTRWRVKMPE